MVYNVKAGDIGAGEEKDPHPGLNNLEGSFRYTLAREGVFAPGGRVFLAHTMQRVSYIVGLAALWLAFVMGYE